MDPELPLQQHGPGGVFPLVLSPLLDGKIRGSDYGLTWGGISEVTCGLPCESGQWLRFQHLRAKAGSRERGGSVTNMTLYRAKQDAIPQPDVRIRRGGRRMVDWRVARPEIHASASSPSHGRLQERIAPWTYPALGRRCHGFARTTESLRGVRLPLVPAVNGCQGVLLAVR